ncbi:MAG: ATP synthase F1 subunit delta [Verrucomicrobiota bacterium]
MKINGEARNKARKLFALCQNPQGGVNDSIVSEVLRLVEEKKLRNAIGILSHFKKLVELELAEVRTEVTSAQGLDSAQQKMIGEKLKSVFGEQIDLHFETDREVLGGLKIKSGSTVWDGTISSRLQQLAKQF